MKEKSSLVEEAPVEEEDKESDKEEDKESDKEEEKMVILEKEGS